MRIAQPGCGLQRSARIRLKCACSSWPFQEFNIVIFLGPAAGEMVGKNIERL